MSSVAVPEVIGQSQSEAEGKLTAAGLTVGTIARTPSLSVPAGNVTGASPVAGTNVDQGSTVNLNVSSGPAQVATGSAIQTAVPDVTGLTRTAAETALKGAGMTIGPVKNRPSDEVPYGGAVSTNPAPGALVTPATPIELFLSSGPRYGFMNYLPTVLFSVLGITVLWLIGYIVTQEKQVFLRTLSDKEVARGLITFLIAIATVGIALILAISTLALTEGSDGDKRFDRGKQVLSVLIGVLGTIVGFYFGSADSSAPKPPIQTERRIVTTSLPIGEVDKPYPLTTIQTTGMTPPLSWKVAPALPGGLQLDAAAGTIHGTPTSKLGKTKFDFAVTDGSTPALSSNVALDLEIK